MYFFSEIIEYLLNDTHNALVLLPPYQIDIFLTTATDKCVTDFDFVEIFKLRAVVTRYSNCILQSDKRHLTFLTAFQIN